MDSIASSSLGRTSASGDLLRRVAASLGDLSTEAASGAIGPRLDRARCDELGVVAPAFVAMAHSIVWCSAATVDRANRPRSRILHPVWTYDGRELIGWIAVAPTPVNRAHLAHGSYLSCNYWSPTHDTCVAECDVEWVLDLPTRTMVWNLIANAPAPVGYEPSMVPGWDAPSSSSFATLRLTPWRLRVFAGSSFVGGEDAILRWARA